MTADSETCMLSLQMKYDHQINKLKHVWESKKDEAVREVEAKSEVITAELGNLQQVCMNHN